MAEQLQLGAVGSNERRAVTPRQVLALSGGGFRGAFTVRVLSRLEAASKQPLRERFDLLAGTSIGGLLAIAVACGVPAAQIDVVFPQLGREIFTRRRGSVLGLASARYSAGPLAKACRALLGDWADRPFHDIPKALVVVAIEERLGRPRLFRTAELKPPEAEAATVLDAALATSAAPTFFPPHRIGGEALVDGGLIANAPDLVAVMEAGRALAAAPGDLRLLSIGTAGSARSGGVAGAPGGVAWLLRHRLIELTLDAQQALAMEQVARLGLAEHLRFDRAPPVPVALDDARPETARLLYALADEAYDTAAAGRAAELRTFLSHRG